MSYASNPLAAAYPLRRVPSAINDELENPQEKLLRQNQQEVAGRIAAIAPQRVASTPVAVAFDAAATTRQPARPAQQYQAPSVVVSPEFSRQPSKPPPASSLATNAATSTATGQQPEPVASTAGSNPYIARVPSFTEVPSPHTDEENAATINASAPVPARRYGDPRIEHALGPIPHKRIVPALPPPVTEVIDPNTSMPVPASPTSPSAGVTASLMREPEPTRGKHSGGFKSRLKDGLLTFLQGLSMPQSSSGDGRQDFFNRLGAGVGAFGVGVVNPQLAHDLAYGKELALYDERRKREHDQQRRDIEAEKTRVGLESDKADIAYKTALIGNLNTDNNQKALDSKNKSAGEAVKLAQKYRQPVPLESVKGTIYEGFANLVPAAELNLEDITKFAPYGFVPDRKTQAELEKALGGSFPNGFSRVASDSTPQTFRDERTGKVYYTEMEKDPQTGKSRPVLKQMQGEKLTPRVEKPDQGLARNQARVRVSREYSGEHINSMIADRAAGLYSTYAQRAGITWQDEQAARQEGVGEDEPDTSRMSDVELQVYMREMMTGGGKAKKTKGALIRAIQSQSRREAEAIVKRDLERLEDKYFEEELNRASSSNFEPERAPSNSGTRPSKKVFPASKLKEAARQYHMSELSFRQKLANDGVTIAETR